MTSVLEFLTCARMKADKYSGVESPGRFSLSGSATIVPTVNLSATRPITLLNSGVHSDLPQHLISGKPGAIRADLYIGECFRELL